MSVEPREIGAPTRPLYPHPIALNLLLSKDRRPHGLIVGTPIMVADYMQEIFHAQGCDGFVLQGNVTPGMFEEFGRMVVPELQNRGLVRTEYTGSTMRQNLLG
jgi:alkanesulfonate monooxygenase SsuD/methylene tetrahydromethanopterin reductase-like flavin-dependent oxidoreductase (luciferase family)